MHTYHHPQADTTQYPHYTQSYKLTAADKAGYIADTALSIQQSIYQSNQNTSLTNVHA